MDAFIQPKITGYRQLTEEEAALMNEGKALAEKCGEYIAKLRFYIPTPTGGECNNVPGAALDQRWGKCNNVPGAALDQRWIIIGATDIQKGFMCLTRGIAQPTTF